MEERVAEFEKVSFEEFKSKYDKLGLGANLVEDYYRKIKLPARATSGSAGHDIYLPMSIYELFGGYSSDILPMGIKVKIKQGWVGMIYPRSSLGMKGLMVSNTVGIIDSDYYNNPNNEGHIMLRFTNLSKDKLTVSGGDRVAQMLFMPYGVADGSSLSTDRSGGIGSTGKS